jgi:hypothetical protein
MAARNVSDFNKRTLCFDNYMEETYEKLSRIPPSGALKRIVSSA